MDVGIISPTLHLALLIYTYHVFSDKSTSTTYALVHRPQNDPKIHDASTSSMVFQELHPPQAQKAKDRGRLESELSGFLDGGATLNMRDNEGEAAENGIYYDDTEYDYMQHMRDLNGGDGSGESFFMEAPVKRKERKEKGKMSLEDALREASIRDDSSEISNRDQVGHGNQLLDDEILPSKYLRRTTYQDQQDVPDALTGFQPDMDPRLREVLEALEDEAYVDNDEDIFGEISAEREELSLEDFRELHFADGTNDIDDDGWESDHTAKPSQEYKVTAPNMPISKGSIDVLMSEEAPDHGDGDWMAAFSKFKQANKAGSKVQLMTSNVDYQPSILSNTSGLNGRHKKRKGALTSSTGYSMSSASLVRTDGLSLLDARFDKIEQEYAEDGMDEDGGDWDGTGSVVSGAESMASIDSKASAASRNSTTSKASNLSQAPPSLVTSKDFDGIMDEFLGGYSMNGKKRVKKGGWQSGMQQLDEIRRDLGKPVLRGQKA